MANLGSLNKSLSLSQKIEMTVIFVVEFASFIECTSQIHQNKVPNSSLFGLLLFTSFYHQFFVSFPYERIVKPWKNGKKNLGKGRVTLPPLIPYRQLDASTSSHRDSAVHATKIVRWAGSYQRTIRSFLSSSTSLIPIWHLFEAQAAFEQNLRTV